MSTGEYPTELAKILDQNRLRAGSLKENRHQQAKRLGFSDFFLRRIEAGHLPRDTHKAQALARALGRDPARFCALIERERRARQAGAN